LFLSTIDCFADANQNAAAQLRVTGDQSLRDKKALPGQENNTLRQKTTTRKPPAYFCSCLGDKRIPARSSLSVMSRTSSRN